MSDRRRSRLSHSRTTVTTPATTLGPPSAIKLVENLAGAYRSAGRAAEAITLYEQALTDRRRVLGDGHPDTRNTESLLRNALNGSTNVVDR